MLNPLPGGEDFLANPALPEDILREAVQPLGVVLHMVACLSMPENVLWHALTI